MKKLLVLLILFSINPLFTMTTDDKENLALLYRAIGLSVWQHHEEADEILYQIIKNSSCKALKARAQDYLYLIHGAKNNPSPREN